MNFHLSAIDDRVRHPDDRPTIGILLGKSRSRLVAEYAQLRGNLPTLKQLESGLAKFSHSHARDRA